MTNQENLKNDKSVFKSGLKSGLKSVFKSKMHAVNNT